MKHKILYLFLFLVIVAAGCIKSSNSAPPPPIPSGTFSGQFKLYQRHTDKVPYDSLITNITVNFKTPDFTYYRRYHNVARRKLRNLWYFWFVYDF